MAPRRGYSSPGPLPEQGALSGSPTLQNLYQKDLISVSLSLGISATGVEDIVAHDCRGCMSGQIHLRGFFKRIVLCILESVVSFFFCFSWFSWLSWHCGNPAGCRDAKRQRNWDLMFRYGLKRVGLTDKAPWRENPLLGVILSFLLAHGNLLSIYLFLFNSLI